MNPPIARMAAEIISAANAERPADSVLRDVLRSKPGLARQSGREVSRAVFAYYRWRGWITSQSPLEAQVAEAEALNLRFEQTPESYTDLTPAIPEWTRQCLEVTPQWLQRLQTRPLLWLRTRRQMADTLIGRLDGARPGPLPDSIQYVGSADLYRVPEFHEGLFELQDINSQVVSRICDPQPGSTWWDACAGEGGKTLHLSELMENKGLIWATDRAEWRLKQLKARARRAQCFNYRTKPWTGSGSLPTKTRFDGVLLDAPCSGLGTWQRNPHARWTTQLTDVRELAAFQKSLLAQAAQAVKPGGRLIYAVCTLTRDETTEVSADFDQAHPEFVRAPFVNPFQPSGQPPVSELTLWPQDNGGNGMFIAAWTRKMTAS
jgi:16S rRNA (cytosine967-C5)-methyltransferase